MIETNKLKRYYRAITAICLCFLAVGISFTVFMMTDNKKQNISYFKETTASMKNTVTNLITSNFETLDGVALTIGEMEVTDLEHLLPVIRQINDRNTFYRMGFIHADGRGDMVDLDGTIHQELNFAEELFYQEAMEGKQSLSRVVKDRYSNTYLNYYGVPVVIQGETIGVLAAADYTDRLRTVLDTSIFSRGGFSNIIDSRGDYVIRSQKSSEINSIREAGDFAAHELETLMDELMAGKENLIEFKQNGSETWAMYIPLGINDWFLLGIVQEDKINGNYYSILGTVLLIAAATGIFMFLFYCMNRIQAKNERRLEDLAYKDPLLGINNFVKFSIDMDNKLAKKAFKKVAFWYGDIDNFKIFNESFGYDTGDELLEDMAKFLQTISSQDDDFCRESADHFAGIQYYQERSELIRWHEQLSEKLEHYEIFGRESFRLVFSVGFYCADSPDALLTVNEMYNRAKMAQKSIKQAKNIKYAFYSEEIRNHLLRENEIEAHMKAALESNCFKVYIQPKTATQEENRIVGGEALVRWAVPGKGMISPAEFIPLFEKNGFIIPLDRFMFERVCIWLRDYLDEGGRPIRIAVNVSRLGIFQEDFIAFYTNTKHKYQIPDGLVELEFTESLAIEDNALLGRRVRELQEQGFICSLDDFGAGYSSLNTLKELPIEVLKLDILFFQKGTDEKKANIIVENIIHLAKQLNIRIVAEGVEEPKQVDFLKSCGCDVIQGFVFERPIPADSFKKLLKKDPRGDWGAGFGRTADRKE